MQVQGNLSWMQTLGQSRAQFWAPVGHQLQLVSPIVLALTTAEADAEGTWPLPVLINGTLSMVCTSPGIM